MKWGLFKTQASGKWVLTGEHSVLRGGTALALPHHEIGLTLTFEPTQGTGLSVLPETAESLIHELMELVNSVGENLRPQGRLTIESTIPVGAGLGSSAALCVALSRWMSVPLEIEDSKLTDFATHLEHRFHGRSSGMDVAAISLGEPISFVMGKGSSSLGVKKLPQFTFHDTALRSRTSECVLKVEEFRTRSPGVARSVDDAMSAASQLAIEGLVIFDRGDIEGGLALLKRAMQQGQKCFESWDLLPDEARRLEEKLMHQGALAVKLTGAGGGGMVVALWPVR